MVLESSDPSKVTAPPKEGTPALLEGMHSVIVTTSALDDVFAPGPELQPELGRRRPLGSGLPADTERRVQLLSYAGQSPVPEKQGRVCALFLLPACNLPHPHLEGNRLCPTRVHRN